MRARRLINGVRARAEAAFRYAPRVYDGPVTLFRSTEVEQESAKTFTGAGPDALSAARGWDRLTARPLTIRFVPGHHVTMVNEPNVGILADELKRAIDATRRGAPL